MEFSFVGTNYHGWQLQKNAHSVQAEMNTALSTLFQEEISCIGCGRTDTGVHARQFFAHFDTKRAGGKEDLNKWTFQLNCLLPKDIGVNKIISVKDNANARFDAYSRTYEYHIIRKKDPFKDNFACFLYGTLDVAEMNKAAEILLEHTDFSCFSKSRTQVKTNECEVTYAKWKTDKDKNLVFTITANRFLRGMVRAIVGTLVDIGQGKLQAEDFHKIIEGKKRSAAGESMPACGLFLVDIKYPYLSND